jgi:pimeloyl-ACP methyl ester carboxylesterase
VLSGEPEVAVTIQPAPPAPADGATGSGTDWGVHAEWLWRGQRCHWRALGDAAAPALVLVHGFAAGSGHWRRNAAVLAAAGWRVYGLDLIGFGASSQPALRLDNRLWARQLQAFLEQVVQGPAVLVGHSLGGLVTLSCAVLFPRWVRAVVAAPLPDPTLMLTSLSSPPRRPPWWRRLQRWLVTVLCRLLPLELLVPLLAHSPLLDLGIQSAYNTPVIGDRDLHRVIARPARRPGAVRALRAMSIAMALRPHAATAPALLRRLQQPLLLIWGQRDRLVPVQVAQQVQRLRPDLPLVLLDGSGHCPHDEQAEAFNAALLTWLEQLPASGPPPGPTPSPGR